VRADFGKNHHFSHWCPDCGVKPERRSRKKVVDESFNGLLLSETALAKDWNTPEEDAAGASL